MKACSRTDAHTCAIGAHLAQPTCAHCGAPDPIRGDGPMTLVCRRCVAALGRIAAEPFSVHPNVLREIAMASIDVVALAGERWLWTVLWPGVGDARLISGRVADGRLA